MADIKDQITPDMILEYLKSYMAGKPTAKYQDQFKQAGKSKEEADALISSYMQTPEGRTVARDIAQNKASDRFVSKNLPLFNMLVQGADIATSISQIHKSNAALKGLNRPGMPQSPGIDPALNNEIYKAQVGSFDQSRAIAPLKQAATDQYNVDLNTAAQVSGGNAASYAAQANAAGMRRVRNMAGAPAIADNIKAREQARLQGLIDTRQNAAQNNFNNNYNLGKTSLDQYNQNMLAASQLGQVGRSNLRNVFQTLPDNALGAVGRNLGTNDPYASYGEKVTNSLAGLQTLRQPMGQVQPPSGLPNRGVRINQYVPDRTMPYSEDTYGHLYNN